MSTLKTDVLSVTYATTTTARSADNRVVIGTIVGILKVDIAANSNGQAYVSGNHKVAKKTNAPWVVGGKVYLIAATGVITTVSTSNTFAGVAAETATTTQATGRILLNFGQA